MQATGGLLPGASWKGRIAGTATTVIFFGKIIKLHLSLERLILVPARKAYLQSPGTHVPTALKSKCLA